MGGPAVLTVWGLLGMSFGIRSFIVGRRNRRKRRFGRRR